MIELTEVDYPKGGLDDIAWIKVCGSARPDHWVAYEVVFETGLRAYLFLGAGETDLSTKLELAGGVWLIVVRGFPFRILPGEVIEILDVGPLGYESFVQLEPDIERLLCWYEMIVLDGPRKVRYYSVP